MKITKLPPILLVAAISLILCACDKASGNVALKQGDVELLIPKGFVSKPRAWWTRFAKKADESNSILLVVPAAEINKNLSALDRPSADSVVLVTLVDAKSANFVLSSLDRDAKEIEINSGKFIRNTKQIDLNSSFTRVIPEDSEIYGTTLLAHYPPRSGNDIVATCRKAELSTKEICNLRSRIKDGIVVESSIDAGNLKDAELIGDFIAHLVYSWKRP